MSKLLVLLAISLATSSALPDSCPDSHLPTYWYTCGDWGGSADMCCNGLYAEAKRSMCSHPYAEGGLCVNISQASVQPIITDDPSVFIRVSTQTGDAEPLRWELDMWDTTYDRSSLITNQFETREGALFAANLLKNCTAQTCVIEKVKCHPPLPWMPCPDQYYLNTTSPNARVGYINTVSVHGSAEYIVEVIEKDGTTAPIQVALYLSLIHI
eukprot:TRINITY_DN8113_c0_g1_i4.p2 TRINITY_DN8113_c0_g1~~TRINITY_DN8113_c0_g1_i4.p2  ORF type:complete len:212 (+),score=59.49 TRINITY_DN8113_c0_g1_i4:219-854(+)